MMMMMMRADDEGSLLKGRQGLSMVRGNGFRTNDKIIGSFLLCYLGTWYRPVRIHYEILSGLDTSLFLILGSPPTLLVPSASLTLAVGNVFWERRKLIAAHFIFIDALAGGR